MLTNLSRGLYLEIEMIKLLITDTSVHRGNAVFYYTNKITIINRVVRFKTRGGGRVEKKRKKKNTRENVKKTKFSIIVIRFNVVIIIVRFFAALHDKN